MAFVPLYLFGAILLIFSSSRNDKLISMVFYLIGFVILFTFRNERFGGIDIYTYFLIFQDTSYWNIKEPTFLFIFKILSLVGESYYVFSFFVATSVTFLLGHFFKKLDSRSAFSGVLLFTASHIFYIMEINTFRYALATLLFANAVVMRKSWWILASVGSLLHYATILYFPFVLMARRLVLNRSILFLAMLTYIAPFAFQFRLAEFVLNMLGEAIPIIAHRAKVSSELIASGAIGRASFDHNSIFILLALLSIFLKPDLFRTRVTQSVSNMIVLLSFLFPIAIESELLFDRIFLLSNLLSFGVLGIVFCYSKSYLEKSLFLFLYISLVGFTLFFWGPRNFLGEYFL